MTKQEFKALTKRDFTDKEYETIETVYTFHRRHAADSGQGQRVRRTHSQKETRAGGTAGSIQRAEESQHNDKGGIRRDRKARSQKEDNHGTESLRIR